MRRLTNLLMGLAVAAVQLGACQGTQPASTGEVADPDQGPTLTGLEKMLEHQLARRGLSRSDLVHSPQTEALAATYARAVEAREVEAARGAHARLLASLDAVLADPELPEAKLARVQALFEAQRGGLPDARVEALEAHLSTLRERLGDPEQRAALITALTSVETQLGRK